MPEQRQSQQKQYATVAHTTPKTVAQQAPQPNTQSRYKQNNQILNSGQPSMQRQAQTAMNTHREAKQLDLVIGPEMVQPPKVGGQKSGMLTSKHHTVGLNSSQERTRRSSPKV